MITQTVVDQFDEKFRRVKYMISTSWLDFVGDLGHDVDTGIFKRNFFYRCRI